MSLHGSCNPTAVSPQHLDEYVAQIAEPGALRAGIEYYASAWEDVQINQASMQTLLTMPVLSVCGRYNLGELVARAAGALAADVRSAVVDGAGHWVADENRGGLTDVLLDFVHAPSLASAAGPRPHPPEEAAMPHARFKAVIDADFDRFSALLVDKVEYPCKHVGPIRVSVID